MKKENRYNGNGTLATRLSDTKSIIKCLTDNYGEVMSAKDIIDWCIERDLTHDYPRGEEDGHPFSPTITVMCDRTNKYYQENLHRSKAYKGRSGNLVYVYWLGEKKPSKEYSFEKPVKKTKKVDVVEKRPSIGDRVLINGRWMTLTAIRGK